MQSSSPKLFRFVLTLDPGEYSPNAFEAYPDRFFNLIINWGTWEWCGLVPASGIAQNRKPRWPRLNTRMPCSVAGGPRGRIFCLQAYGQAAIVPGAAYGRYFRLLYTLNVF